MDHQSIQQNEDISKNEIMLLESAFYVAGRPLELRTLCNILGTRSKDKALKTARRLVEKYNTYNGSLELLELGDQRFVMQLKTEYAQKVRRLSFQSVLTKGPLRTLSYIAYYQPVLQTTVADARGNHAYRHMKLLEEKKLIAKKEVGRTSSVRTTPFFADYFGLSQNPRAFKRQIKQMFKPKTSKT